MDDLNEPLRAEKKRLEERLQAVNQLLGVSIPSIKKEPAKGQRYHVDFAKMDLPATFTSTHFRDALSDRPSAPTLTEMLKKLELTKIIRKIKPAKGRSPAVYVKLKTLLGYSPVKTTAKVHSKGHR